MYQEAPEAWSHLSMILPLIILIVSFSFTVIFVVLPFWFICKKAGFSGALSLLMLVPVCNIILPFYIAFAEWPALNATSGTDRGKEWPARN